MKKTTVLFCLFFSFLSSAQTTLYLVRHAEKVTSSATKDPELTAIGQFRAQNIAKMLSNAGISRIFSSDYQRTMQTAQPLADYLNLEIEIYRPEKLAQFAGELKNSKENILIVGHSNTTPKLAEYLSGQHINSMTEEQYDTLYQVILIPKQKAIVNHFKTIPSQALKQNKIIIPVQKKDTKHAN